MTILVSYLSQNFGRNSLQRMNEYGRMAAQNPLPPPPPPPPPQLYFPASSDEYHLGSRSTITTPPSLLFASIDPGSKLAETVNPYRLASALPRFFNGIFDRLVKASSWMLSTAVAILFASSRAIFVIGPLALVAYALQDSYTLRKDHDAVARALLDIRKREEGHQDAIRQLEITVQRQKDVIKHHEVAFHAQRRRSREATRKLERDLKSAQEHIDSLRLTVQSHSRQLQERATAPTPAQIPEAQAGTQAQPHAPIRFHSLARGQTQFTPRPTRIPGLSPDRTRGFEETGHPAGRGRVIGRGGGSGGGQM